MSSVIGDNGAEVARIPIGSGTSPYGLLTHTMPAGSVIGRSFDSKALTLKIVILFDAFSLSLVANGPRKHATECVETTLINSIHPILYGKRSEVVFDHGPIPGDSTGHMQKHHFGMQRLYLALNRGNSGTNKDKATFELFKKSGPAKSASDITLQNNGHQLGLWRRENNALQALDTSESLSLRSAMDNVLSMPDLAGLARRPSQTLKQRRSSFLPCIRKETSKQHRAGSQVSNMDLLHHESSSDFKEGLAEPQFAFDIIEDGAFDNDKEEGYCRHSISNSVASPPMFKESLPNKFNPSQEDEHAIQDQEEADDGNSLPLPMQFASPLNGLDSYHNTFAPPTLIHAPNMKQPIPARSPSYTLNNIPTYGS
ncbi:hypothetical protein BT96DRAFT_950495 [Gymnopus androsaceus JB14]|uniref:Uncharacterized protein n=1 Tax=Gymnopus androsaceus JB14 TaxID=1447944 RepID=A0A6A4GGK8_9AGAR|nr:hypothetical protein BT96DRAFT_950495 [Gymnopus androsaceus JB14]